MSTPEGLVLRELAPGVSVEEVQIAHRAKTATAACGKPMRCNEIPGTAFWRIC